MGININNSIHGNVNRMVQMNDAEMALNELAAPVAVSQEGTDGIFSLLASELHREIISYCDLRTTKSLACVNRYFNACVKAYEEQIDLKRDCPKLTILDAKAQGITVDDEPKVSKLQVLKWYNELTPHVENEEGLTLLTMTKGLTLKQLVAIAEAKGIAVNLVRDEILREHGNVAVEQTYIIVITDSVFKKSRSKTYAQQQALVGGHKCVMPIVQEQVAHWVFTNIVFRKCLYSQSNGQILWTYGRSSTRVGNYSLVVGGSAPARVDVFRDYGLDDEVIGVGGRRKL